MSKRSSYYNNLPYLTNYSTKTTYSHNYQNPYTMVDLALTVPPTPYRTNPSSAFTTLNSFAPHWKIAEKYGNLNIGYS